MKENLFRKNAIAHLSNPDDLHSAIQLTRSYDWLGLVSLMALTLFALLWSILTKVPITVSGEGIILDSTGVLEKVVTAGAAGRIAKLKAAPGSKVEEGQVIAEIDQTELRNKLNGLEDKYVDLGAQLHRLQLLHRREKEVYQDFETQQRQELQEYITSLSRRLNVLRDLEKGTQNILDKQLASNKDLFDIIIQISETENYLSQSKSQLHSLTLDKETNFNAKEKEILRVVYEINNTQREMDLLRLSIKNNSQVRSRYSGIVSEIKFDEGEIVEAGSPIVSLISEEFSGYEKDSLQAVLYASPEEGKKVKVGMPVNIYPSIYKREEFGGILGEVLKVKNITATPEGILRVTKNEQLVEMLTEKGAPFEIWVRLEKTNTHSGLRWNASDGPTEKIEVGTLCLGETLVREVSLITLLLPSLEPYLNKDYRPPTVSNHADDIPPESKVGYINHR